MAWSQRNSKHRPLGQQLQFVLPKMDRWRLFDKTLVPRHWGVGQMLRVSQAVGLMMLGRMTLD